MFAEIKIAFPSGEGYLNGYESGFYQILVTAFEPDTGYVESLLSKNGNILIYPKKKKGSSQRGSGNKVPSHLSESPFANSIAETAPEVKSSDETSSDGKRFALDVDSEGTRLTEAQQEFFKDSKVRDSKGRLLVMYHGTTANFNTFKKGDVLSLCEALR